MRPLVRSALALALLCSQALAQESLRYSAPPPPQRRQASITNNTVTTMATFTCASDTVCAAIVEYGVEVNDGASHHQQVETGTVVCNVTNANGTFLAGGTNGCTKYGNQQLISASGGTLAVTWTMTAANPALLRLNSNTGTITPAAGFPRITYTVRNATSQAVSVP